MAKTRSIPPATQWSLQARLERHAATEWKGRCRSVVVRFRGAFAYVDALRDEDDATPLHLCRLGYLGNPNRWEFAFYAYSSEKYEPSLTLSGEFTATPEEAFDTAAFTYLQG